MAEIQTPKEEIEKIRNSLESAQEVNKVLIENIVANKCPRCHNNLEKINEKGNDTDHPKFGYFSYWSCPVCGWNTKEKALRDRKKQVTDIIQGK